MDETDIAIIGAGVGGLVLGLCLQRSGFRVTIVERHRRPSRMHKGELLQPSSVRILEEAGAMEAVRDAGLVHPHLLSCRNGPAELLTLDYSRLPVGPRHLSITTYHDLVDALEGAYPGPLMRPITVSGLLTGARGRVTGVRLADGSLLRARAVVAADGNASAIRQWAALDSPITRYPHALVSVGMPDPGVDPTRVVAHLTPGGLRLIYPLPGGAARVYLQAPSPDAPKPDVIGWTRRRLLETPGLEHVAASLDRVLDPPQVLQACRFMAKAWTRPGLVLLGDAAHGVHPMAAQGMNAAIADADVLARELRAVPPDAPDHEIDEALHRYERTRRDHATYVSRLSHRLAVLFTDQGFQGRVLGRAMVRRNRRNDYLQDIITLNMSGLGLKRFSARDRLVQFGVLPEWRRGALTPAGSGNAQVMR